MTSPITLAQQENAAEDAATHEDVVNGSASPGMVTSRLGRALRTLAKLEADMEAAALAAMGTATMYASTSAGVAATSNGQYFQVVGSGNTWSSLYKNVAGVATFIASYASKALIDSALNPLLVSKGAGNLPWEDFDRAEGFTVQGMTSKSGHAFVVSGTGAATAAIANNCLVSSANLYFGMDAAQLITEGWGVISFTQLGTGGTTGGDCVLMFNGNGTTDLSGGLIHCTFGIVGVTVLITSTGAGSLTPIGGTVTEVHNLNTDNNYIVPYDGSKHVVGIRFIQKATTALDELWVYGPGGRVFKYVGNTTMRAIMATCRWNTGQISGPVPTDGVQGRWHAFQSGPRRADIAGALAGVALKEDLIQLTTKSFVYNKRARIYFRPTATGWYKVANGVIPSVNAYMGGEISFFGSSSAGQFGIGRVVFGYEPGLMPKIETKEFPVGLWAAAATVDAIRLSSNGVDAGVRQLEVHVGVYGSSTVDYIVIDLDGMFTPFTAPVVGSTALGSYVRTQYLNLTGDLVSMGSDANLAIVPGVDPNNIYLGSAVSTTRAITIADANAIHGDEFLFVRPAAASNSMTVANLSDGTVLKTLAAGTWARFKLYTSSGKFILTEYGAL